MPRTPKTRQQKVAAAIDAFNQADRLLHQIDLRHVPRLLQPSIRDARAAARQGRDSLTEGLRLDVPEQPFPRTA